MTGGAGLQGDRRGSGDRGARRRLTGGPGRAGCCVAALGRGWAGRGEEWGGVLGQPGEREREEEADRAGLGSGPQGRKKGLRAGVGLGFGFSLTFSISIPK